MRKIQRKKKVWSRIARLAIVLGLWLVVLGILGFFTAFMYYAPQIPDPESIITRRINESTKILDRTGQTVLFSVFGEEKRTIIPPEQIPVYAKQAVIAAEDANFYEHSGLDLSGISRAIFVNIKTQEFAQGGSTITQQMVRNSLLGRQKTFSRKFKEVILALQAERKFDKEQILWIYLNQISFGSNIFGIEEAAQRYFAKPAKELTLNESAVLAALIKAPSYYSPYGSHQEELLGRKDLVLQRMNELGFINEDRLALAKTEEIKFSSPNEGGIRAPHFVIMVREYLVEKYGEDMVQNGGLSVYTTLDWDLQQKAEDVVQKYAERNENLFRAGNAALVALDPRTGEVLTLVGSRDYFDIEKEGNFNVITAFRQPGSAFKPIVYSVALDKGLTDRTVIFDVRTEFNPLCSPDSSQERDIYGQDCYHPQNSDDKYRGPVTLRQALGSSLNVPSVKVLSIAGIKDSLKRAGDLGIEFLGDPDQFGLSLVLGGGDVRPLDLAAAYGTFANDGVYNKPSFIQKVVDPEGNILEELDVEPERKISEQTARMVNNILSDNSARALLFGLRSPLYVSDRAVAVKTGTTQKFRDAWTIGYTPSIVVGVWVGNNDNTEMTREGGGVSAGAPIWREFMLEALKNIPAEDFPAPAPIFSDKIMLNGSFETEDGAHTILRFIDPSNPQGPIPANPERNPQYKNWEWAIRFYFTKESQASGSEESPLIELPLP